MSIKQLLCALMVLMLGCATANAQDKLQHPKAPAPQAAPKDEAKPAAPAEDAAEPTLRILLMGPSVQDLEGTYSEAWQRIAVQYYSVDALKNWGSWEKKYTGKLSKMPDLDAALKEMTASLGDRWTTYTSPLEMMEQSLRHMVGVVDAGIWLKHNANGQYQVEALIYGSPAQKSSLREGDIVKSIDGTELKTLKPAEAGQLVYGAIGKKMKVVYLDGGKESEVELTLAETPDAQVEARMLPDHIAYVRLPDFSSEGHLATLVAKLAGLQKDSKTDIKGLVLDLRGNLGGHFGLAVDAASLFLTQGTVVTARTREGRVTIDQSYKVIPYPAFLTQSMEPEVLKIAELLQKTPLVVLSNGSTASAAEILIGALKDNSRARIVGTTTVGKGTAYTRSRLPNGGMLQITRLKYLTPSGHDVSIGGIRPHKVVAQPRDSTDQQLDAAVAEIKQMLKASAPAGK